MKAIVSSILVEYDTIPCSIILESTDDNTDAVYLYSRLMNEMDNGQCVYEATVISEEVFNILYSHDKKKYSSKFKNNMLNDIDKQVFEYNFVSGEHFPHLEILLNKVNEK